MDIMLNDATSWLVSET